MRVKIQKSNTASTTVLLSLPQAQGDLVQTRSTTIVCVQYTTESTDT